MILIEVCKFNQSNGPLFANHSLLWNLNNIYGLSFITKNLLVI